MDTATKVPILNSAPGKPKGSSKKKQQVTLTWTAPSTSSGTSAPSDYVIQYRLKGKSAWTTFKDGKSTAKKVTVKKLKSGKTYQFRVVPKNWAGTGKASAVSANIKVK